MAQFINCQDFVGIPVTVGVTMYILSISSVSEVMMVLNQVEAISIKYKWKKFKLAALLYFLNHLLQHLMNLITYKAI